MKDKIVELSVLGTGGGYGESIVIKLIDDSWVVIDSCTDPKTGESLPIKFLKEKEVDILTQVKLIVCTHWHNDHIQGISNLLELAINADFYIPWIDDMEKFILFIQFDLKINYDVNDRSTKEFEKCLGVISKRNKPLKRAAIDNIIYNDKINSIQIFSLSPSQEVIKEFHLEISEMIESITTSSVTIPHRKPNEKCIVLFILIENFKILLGADMEISTSVNRGWNDIFNNSKSFEKEKVILFKIPHHGSSNGYSKELCDVILNEKSILKLTPYFRGRKFLPEALILEKYKEYSNEVFITSNLGLKNTPKKREKSIAKAIKELRPSLKEVPFTYGVISTHFDLTTGTITKTTNLYGTAVKI